MVVLGVKVFEIHFHVGDLDHVVHKRYSQLRSIHDQVST